jgi:hypothetical protein
MISKLRKMARPRATRVAPSMGDGQVYGKQWESPGSLPIDVDLLAAQNELRRFNHADILDGVRP